MSYSLYKVFIDPGHGGTDVGAKNGTFYEKDFALDIAKHTRDRLASYGVKTKMSRETWQCKYIRKSTSPKCKQ